MTPLMEQVQPESKSLVSEIAKSWGTSRAYVYKLAKKGCPVDSIAAASEWRSANAKLGVGYRSRGAGAPTDFSDSFEGDEGNGAVVAEQPPNWGAGVRAPHHKTRVNVRTIEKSLKQAIRMEGIAAEVAEASQSNPEKMLTAVNVYNRAQANRMEAEKRVLEYLQARGTLISVDEAKKMAVDAIAIFLTRVRSVPKRIAMDVSPLDDTSAEIKIRNGIEDAVEEAQASYAKIFA